MIRSLFRKLLASHIAVILIVTAAIGLLLSHLVTNYLVEVKRGELLREGTAAVKFLDTSIRDKRFMLSLLNNLSDLSGTTMWISDKNNRVISGQPPPGWRHRLNKHRHNRPQEVSGEVQSWIYRDRGDEDPSIVVAVPFPQNPTFTLFLYTPITGISETSFAIQRLLFYSIVGATLLASIFAFFVSRSLTDPIRKISRAAERFAGGDYSVRTTAVGQDEIGRLGQTFNEMASALMRIEQNRREFFSDVTHELKTPIAAIQALTESMLDGLVYEEKKRQRYLGTILDETKHMNRLISELLNLAQLESGQLKFNYQAIDLRDFTMSQQQKYQPLLEEKNQHLHFALSPHFLTLKSDKTRLEQILTNLISNAIRHSPEGSEITVDIAAAAGSAVISVIDHGEGIPEKDLPYLWDRFYRVDKSRARSKGGTGLGLSITKKLVEGMGGKITVRSIPNAETVFCVTLPLV